MRAKLIFSLLVLIITTSCTKTESSAIISGQVTNGATSVNLFRLNGDNIFEEERSKSEIDSNGYFTLKVNLEKPTYFYFNGLDIYLCPGDDLNIKAEKNKNVVYSGKAANACNYLRTTPMFKAGSFLKGGIALDRKEVNEGNLLAFADSCLKFKMNELKNTKGVDPYFLKIEETRNYLNAANTLLSYGMYEALRNELDRNEMVLRSKVITEKYHSEIAAYLKCIDQPENIVLGICTHLLNRCKENGFYTKFCPELEEFLLVDDFLGMLKEYGISEAVIAQNKLLMESVKNPAYRQVVEEKWKTFASLIPGVIAPNINFELLNGDKKKLSDYKGKLLVVDVWATWCGPCKNEKPIFAQLANEFKDKPVVFLALSTDDNSKAWKKMLDDHKGENFYENGLAESVDAYNINFIPRFIVIDKDFKIVNAFAPLPSSGELEALIEKNLL